MCGIVGYIGNKRDVTPLLLQGLKRLEYRGYDSAGISIVKDDGSIVTHKQKGQVSELEKSMPDMGASTVGIAHTRWATHGEPSKRNAHPQTDSNETVSIVHNGVIENYMQLRARLEKKGYTMQSETDTEILAHMIAEELSHNVDLATAVTKALAHVRGTYGLAVVSKDDPDKIVVARLGSPIVIGVGKDEYFVSSDTATLLPYTREIIFLEDGEIGVLSKDGFDIRTLSNESIHKRAEHLDWEVEEAEKGGHPHFMLKEMLEQPHAMQDSMRGRLNVADGTVKLGGLDDVAKQLHDINRIIIVACGTASYAALIGEYMMEEYAGIPVEVEHASEFRYRKPLIDKKTAVIAISQSGETADTLAAIREAKNKGALTLGIVNTVGSTIARETDAGVYNHAGPEIGVASTKAFISQLTVLTLYAVFLGRMRSMSMVTGKRVAEELQAIPSKIDLILQQSDTIKTIAEKYIDATNYFFLGRKYNAPIAYEGALKLKEISYVHAEGYPAGEMKHGPIALIDEKFVSVFIAPVDSVYEKTKSNIEETRARGGKIIAVTTEGNKEMESLADDVIYVPKTLEMLSPLVTVIPLQLFAYHMAVLKGNDPDKPRNLAKSVTVE